MPPAPKPTRRWFQYSLGTMLAVVLVCGIALLAYDHSRRLRRAVDAAEEFDRTMAQWDSMMAGSDDALAAADELLRAQLARGVSKLTAYEQACDILSRIENHAHEFETTTYGSREAHDEAIAAYYRAKAAYQRVEQSLREEQKRLGRPIDRPNENSD